LGLLVLPDNQGDLKGDLKVLPRLELYAEGVAQQSPGSRSAAWVGDHPVILLRQRRYTTRCNAGGVEVAVVTKPRVAPLRG
jgi:hypothetical protein